MREVTLPTELSHTTCVLSLDGRFLATYGTSGKVNPWGTRIIDTATWQEIAGFSHDPDLSGNGYFVDDLAFSPDSRYLAMAGNLPRNASVEVRHARSLKLFRRIGTGQSKGIAFSRDGRFLVIFIGEYRSVLAELWDVRGVLSRK